MSDEDLINEIVQLGEELDKFDKANYMIVNLTDQDGNTTRALMEASLLESDNEQE